MSIIARGRALDHTENPVPPSLFVQLVRYDYFSSKGGGNLPRSAPMENQASHTKPAQAST